MRVRPLILAVAASALVGAPPALAAFEPPVRASKGPLPNRSPQLAVNARGDAAAAWIRGRRRQAMIVVSLRPAGGSWSEPEAISRRGRPAIDPEVAVDGSGLAVVTWRQVVGRRTVLTERGRRRQAVYVARARERRVTDARWSPITTLSSPRNKVGPPRLGIDASGAAVAAWHWGTGTSPRAPGFVGQVQVSERDADGGWSPARPVSRSSLCEQVRRPRVAVGPRGHAVVWWQCDLRRDRATAVAVSRAPGEALGSEHELPFRTRGRLSADLAVSGTGRATAVTAAADGTLRWWRGSVGERVPLTGLPALGPTERSDRDTGPPRIAVGDDDDALSGWTDRRGRPRVAPIAADLGVGAPRSLGAPSDDIGPVQVAVGGTGRRAVAAWREGDRVMAAERTVDGALGAGAPVSRRGVVGSPAVAVDAAGGGTVMWTRLVGGRPVVERAETAPS